MGNLFVAASTRPYDDNNELDTHTFNVYYARALYGLMLNRKSFRS